MWTATTQADLGHTYIPCGSEEHYFLSIKISRILTAGWSYQTVDICIIDSSFPYVFLIASLVYSWCSWGSGAGTLHSFFKYSRISRYMTSHSFFFPGFVRLWWLNTIHIPLITDHLKDHLSSVTTEILRGLKTWKRDAGCSRQGSGMILGIAGSLREPWAF